MRVFGVLGLSGDWTAFFSDYRQGETRLFSEVHSDTMKDGVYKLDRLQLLFCDFIPQRMPMAARKLFFFAF